MKFKINNRFKSLFASLLLLGLVSTGPSMAAQQDSVATTETVAQADSSAVASEEATAVAGAETQEAAIDSTGSAASNVAGAFKSEAKPKDEGSKIDPQAYKNLTYYVLLFLVICTIVAIILKVQSVYELTRKTEGKFNPLANNNLQAALLFVFLVLFLAGVYYSYAVWGAWAYRPAATEHGKEVDTMFIITTVITTIVLVFVHILLFTFTYKYRMRKNAVAYYYAHNNTIELVWTLVPAVVLSVLVLFGFFTWRKITNIPEDLQKSAIQIEVLGEQFMWRVRYPGADGVIGKRDYKMTTGTNPYGIDFNDKAAWDDIDGADIVIPVNQSVRFHIKSKDIIHSFYIPDFRVQVNAVPGMTNYFQFTPTMTTEEMREKMNDPEYQFVMLCAKICGSAHYNMQKNVIVVTEAEYKEWLSKQNKYFNEAVQKEFQVTQAKEEATDADLATASLN